METELGRVHYLTTELTFPQDKDQWVKQRPIPGSSVHSIMNFIGTLEISQQCKVDLCRTLRCEWKDNMGVWVRLRIETQRRNTKWGNTKPRVRK